MILRLACCIILSVPAFGQSYRKLHRKAILVDTHNDFPSAAINKQVVFENNLEGSTHTDLQRLHAGGVDVQLFSIWCDGKKENPYAWANRQIDSVHAWVQRNPKSMQLAEGIKEMKQAVKQGKLATMIGVEGGHMIENDLDKLEALYSRGARYLTLTWNNSVSWASSAKDETDASFTGQKGLTDFGKEIIRKMNGLGMLVDLSHVGEQTFYDALATTTKPVLVSHSCVHALCPVSRNLKDEQIKAIAKNGGVIHLNFFSGFIDSAFMPRYLAFIEKQKAELDSMKAARPLVDEDYLQMELFEKYKAESMAMRPALDALLDHLDYIVKLAGIDHVGLGSDFDGISSAPQGLDGVEDFPRITEALMKRGYSKKAIKKILGGNFIRLMKAAEQGIGKN